MASSKTQLLYGFSAAALFLSCFVVGLRLYVRIFLSRAFAGDDVLALAALLSYTTLLSFLIASVSSGFGRHAHGLSPSELSQTMKWYLIVQVLYVVSTCLVKTSFSWTLLRIVSSRVQKNIIYVVLTFTIAFSTSLFFLLLFTCIPISFFWTRFLVPHNGWCRGPELTAPFVYTHGVIMILVDLTLAIIPAIVVLGLQMDRRSKITAIVLLTIGSLASVATIARIPFIRSVQDQVDTTFTSSDLVIWSILELFICIFTTSVATLRPLAKKMALFSSVSNNRPPYASGYIRSGNDNGLDSRINVGKRPEEFEMYRRDRDDHPILTETAACGKTSSRIIVETSWRRTESSDGELSVDDGRRFG